VQKTVSPLNVLMCLLLVDCSGGGSGSSPSAPSATPPPPVVRNYAFAPGKATAPNGGVAWDIIGVKTTLTGRLDGGFGNSYDTLQVAVSFAQDISNALPAPGQPLNSTGNELGINITINSDNNQKTGNFTDCSGNFNFTPFEYNTDQGNGPTRLADGNYSIIGPGGRIYSGAPNPSSEAVTSVSGNVMTETFFLTAINVASGSSIPKFGIAVDADNGVGTKSTDCVPADGSVELPVS